jgi:hypothetical protein
MAIAVNCLVIDPILKIIPGSIDFLDSILANPKDFLYTIFPFFAIRTTHPGAIEGNCLVINASSFNINF